MIRLACKLAIFALLLTMIGLASCSSDSKNPTGNGGGKEFTSGDLGNGQSFQHIFATAGSYPYFCRYHGAAGGVGMSGTVTVAGTGTPTMHNFSITANTLPSTTVHVNDTVRWTNNTAMTHTVESDN